MNTGLFIERPILSTVLSLLIVILGIIGLAMLPIEQYPEITPPVVKIGASYSGASATTVSQAVATPIEQQLNGTPGMIYMESSSSNSGSLSISVTFDVNTNIDLAAVDSQQPLDLQSMVDKSDIEHRHLRHIPPLVVPLQPAGQLQSVES